MSRTDEFRRVTSIDDQSNRRQSCRSRCGQEPQSPAASGLPNQSPPKLPATTAIPSHCTGVQVSLSGLEPETYGLKFRCSTD